MSADDELRRHLRSQLFSSVAELADLEFQRATWLDPDIQNPHYSFVEFVECFYDVAAGTYTADDRDAKNAPLSHLLDNGHISQAERDAIWPLHVALRRYVSPDCHNHEAILRDPKWLDVCAVARQARSALAALVSDPHELDFFENQLPSASERRWP